MVKGMSQMKYTHTQLRTIILVCSKENVVLLVKDSDIMKAHVGNGKSTDDFLQVKDPTKTLQHPD